MAVLKHTPQVQEGRLKTEWAFKAVASVPESLKPLMPPNAIYIEGFANTPNKDEQDDIILATRWTDAVITDYLKKGLLLYEHDLLQPIGKILEAERRDTPGEKNGLFVRGFVSKSWPEAYKVEEGLIESMSVRIRYDWDITTYDEPTKTYFVGVKKLREISICSIGAEEESVFETFKSLHLQTNNKMSAILDWVNKTLGLSLTGNETAEQLLEVTKSIDFATKADLEAVKATVTAEKITEEVKKGFKTEDFVSKSDFDALKKSLDDQALAMKALATEVAKSLSGKGEGQNNGGGNLNLPDPSNTGKNFGRVVQKIEI